MPKTGYVFELSAQSFPQSALQNSFQLPVLVEFMGIWSGPCISMADRLAQLANEFASRFVFAKVDIEEQPALREQYRIENVPTLVVLRNGEEIRREVGELDEPELRSILKDLDIFRTSDQQREQARKLHMDGDTQAAILLLTEAIKSDPSNIRIALDMVQIFLDMGELQQAEGLFQRLPEATRQSPHGQSLLAQIKFASLAAATDGIDTLRQRIDTDPDDHNAHFDLAICLVALHDIDAAMEHLFVVQEKQPTFREGAAREMIGLLSNMLINSNPDAANAYRRRLANLVAKG